MDHLLLLVRMKRILIFALAFLGIRLFAGAATNPYYLRTTFYLDWFGARYEADSFLNQLSSRLRFEFSNNSSRDWTFLLDVRDRYKIVGERRNQFILYDARIIYDPQNKPLYFSAGQMNLYDTAGIGQILGGVIGFKLKRAFLVGGYIGLEQETYIRKVDSDYRKYGVFARYNGASAKSLSLSYNHLHFSGETEQQYVYAQAFLPVQKRFFVFGNVQYELGPRVASKDRLSLIFINARLDLAGYADVTAYFSSGKGLDFHRYLLEKSQDPSTNDQELQRFFYSQMYGVRLSFKPVQDIRIYVSRQESEQKDYQLKNYTWRLGVSLWDILRTGFSLYGDYSFNRGALAESDSYYLSLNKDFGRISWSVTFSNTFNGFRFAAGTASPQIIHFSDYKTLTTSLIVCLNPRISFFVEYDYYIQENVNQHIFYLRLSFRR